MTINTFKLEEYLSQHEFSAKYLLCCSDAESMSMTELVNMASIEHKFLWNNLKLGYTEVQGLPILREKIASSLYPGLEADNILTFSGAEEGIFCSLFTMCDPGDHVIVLTPCYQSLKEIPRLKGCELTCITLREENNWRIDLEEIRKAIKSNTKWLVINFPHNPTGQVITQPELDSLIQLLDKYGIWLFADEVYRLLGTPKDAWALPAAVLYPKAISLGVMSKAWGLAGLRLGWIACQDKAVIKKIELFKHYTTICNSAPSEVLSLIALDNQDTILQKNNKIVSGNLELLDKFFLEYSNDFSWVRPQGGCVGFVKYLKNDKVADFCSNLLNETGVLLMPASLYDKEENYFRIGFGRQDMKIALDKLIEHLRA